MRGRLQLVIAVAALMLIAWPLGADAQGRRGGGGRVAAPRSVVRVAPRTVIVGGFYRPYYYRPYPYFYGSFFYGPWGWYGSPYWGDPYYGYQRGYYGGGSSLRLQVTPRNAEVFIDGYYAGIVDDFDGVFQRLDVAPGEHDLELFLPGYRSVQQKIYLQPGNTFRVRYTMEPLRPGDPEPVRPDGGQAQAGAQNYPPPPPPGGQPRRGPARPLPPPPPPAPGEPQQPGAAQASGYGTIALRVQPADAEVTIDGERWTGAQAGERLEVQLAAGVHNVEIRKDGYRIYSTDVTVRPGQTATLNVALTRQ